MDAMFAGDSAPFAEPLVQDARSPDRSAARHLG